MSAKHVLEKNRLVKRVGIDSCLISTSTFIHQFLHLVPVVFIWEHMRHVSLVLLVLYVCEVPDWYISAEAGRRAVLQGLRLLEQEQIFPELRVEGQVLDSTTTARCELRVFGSSVNAKKALPILMLRMYLQGLCRSKRRRRSCCKCYRAASGYRKHQTPAVPKRYRAVLKNSCFDAYSMHPDASQRRLAWSCAHSCGWCFLILGNSGSPCPGSKPWNVLKRLFNVHQNAHIESFVCLVVIVPRTPSQNHSSYRHRQSGWEFTELDASSFHYRLRKNVRGPSKHASGARAVWRHTPPCWLEWWM